MLKLSRKEKRKLADEKRLSFVTELLTSAEKDCRTIGDSLIQNVEYFFERLDFHSIRLLKTYPKDAHLIRSAVYALAKEFTTEKEVV